jgi:hypothetical protein
MAIKPVYIEMKVMTCAAARNGDNCSSGIKYVK